MTEGSSEDSKFQWKVFGRIYIVVEFVGEGWGGLEGSMSFHKKTLSCSVSSCRSNLSVAILCFCILLGWPAQPFMVEPQREQQSAT